MEKKVKKEIDFDALLEVPKEPKIDEVVFDIDLVGQIGNKDVKTKHQKVSKENDLFPKASHKMKLGKDGHSVGFTEWEEKMLDLMIKENE